jgi:hypothetical protein
MLSWIWWFSGLTVCWQFLWLHVPRHYVGGADKSLDFPIFLFAAQPEEFFLDVLKKLEQRSHKCVELRGEYVQ